MATSSPPIASDASGPGTLAALDVRPETGLAQAAISKRRAEYGFNEVAKRREHPVRAFLLKFWGISAWMLELIMVLVNNVRVPRSQQVMHLPDRAERIALGSIRVLLGRQIRFDDRSQDQHRRHLHRPVADRGDA